MENSGVKCDVFECAHNKQACKCDLATIEITHQKNGSAPVDVPHFCKSYMKK